MISRIEEVAAGIYRLQAQIRGQDTAYTSYFIRDTVNVLIEPGPAVLIPDIQTARKYLGLASLDYIIPTHIHLDHGGAVGGLSRLFPEAKVVVSPRAAAHIIDPSRLTQSTRTVFGQEFEMVYGAMLPVPGPQVKIVADGEKLLASGRELTILHTPGHAPHHIAVFDSQVKGLFCGESLGLIYSDGSAPLPAAPPPAFDIGIYLSSMERLRRLKPRLLFYSHAHDAVTADPDTLISQASENTKIVGDAILQALRSEKTETAVSRRVSDYISNRFGFRLGDFELTSNLAGYTTYFRKNGLVSL